MDARVRQAILVVKNQKEALEFYTKELSFEKKTDFLYPNGVTRWVTVSPGGQDFELALWQEGMLDGTGKPTSWKAAQGPPMTFTVDDCRKAYEELRSKGVEFKQEVREARYGITATFSDPDGNLFNILQPFARASSA